jgi:Family of unknown function (DUF5989)
MTTRTASKPIDESDAMSFFAELSAFMRTHKKFWLTPFIVMMLLLGGLMLTSGSVTPIIHYFDF